MDLFNTVNTKNRTGRWLGELVCTVRSTNRDSQCINTSLLNEVFSFLWVSQQHIKIKFAFCTVAIFFAHLASFQRTQATKLALNRYAAGVSHVYNNLGCVDVVLE